VTIKAVCENADSYTSNRTIRVITSNKRIVNKGGLSLKGKIKKILIFVGILLIIVVIGVIAGFYLSGVMGKNSGAGQRVQDVKSYPIFDLGEFRISLPGDLSSSMLVSFELVLELENDKVLEKLSEDEYWKVLFRNEVIAECLRAGKGSFKSAEGLLRLMDAVVSRLNAVAPTKNVDNPIRRALIKSFIAQ